VASGDPLAALPHALALDIFSRVPADECLRCAEVCAGWRDTLTDASLWTRLDLTRADDAEVSVALLLAAAARARGGLQALRVPLGALRISARFRGRPCFQAALTHVLAQNRALHELCITTPAGEPPLTMRCEVEALLDAAPHLRVLEADVNCERTAHPLPLLLAEPPFERLRMRALIVNGCANADSAAALAAAVAGHACHLTRLELKHVPLDKPAALDALVDAALARRLTSLTLCGCALSPASAPALARLLRSDALTALAIDGAMSDGPVDVVATQLLLDVPAASLLASALRESGSLTQLSLTSVGLFSDVAAATELLNALSEHTGLRTLNLSNNDAPRYCDQEAAGAALSALLWADSPALEALDIRDCGLSNKAGAPIVEALQHSTQLRTLRASSKFFTADFVRKLLLPAVRANTSLRTLDLCSVWSQEDDEKNGLTAEAEALVAARTQPL
jgi:hypothetical protein